MINIYCKIYSKKYIPIIILSIAILSIFIFQHDNNGFTTHPKHHGHLTADGLGIASHITPENNFAMLNKIIKKENGEITYKPYNRFPIGAFGLIKLAISPFKHNYSMQISVGRMLMDLFFVLAMLMAYLSLLKLSQNRWVAVTSTIMAFGSYYSLYYCDMVFNDIPTLFGMMLVFHGITVYVKDKKLLQLYFKSFIALLMGWQVYALLLPFVTMKLGRKFLDSFSIKKVIRSKIFIFGVSSLLFGFFLLFFNFLQEALLLDTPFYKLPSIRSMFLRFGIAENNEYSKFSTLLKWPNFLMTQLYRLGRMNIPYLFEKFIQSANLYQFIGWSSLVISFIFSIYHKYRVVFTSLVLSGLIWAIPMKHFVAFHNFQSIFYIGIPLFIYYLIAKYLINKSKTIALIISIGALTIFIHSYININQQKLDNNWLHPNMTSKLQRISNTIGKNQSIYIDENYIRIGGPSPAVNFFFANNYFCTTPKNAKYIVTDLKKERKGFEYIPMQILTKKKRQRVFLYKRTNNKSGIGRKDSLLLENKSNF